MKQDNGEGVEREFARELHSLLIEFTGLYHQKIFCAFRSLEGSDLRLKKNQDKIVAFLYQGGQVTPSVLSRKLDLEKGSLTTLLDSLEEMGFVVRQGDPRDRRKTLVSLTDRGRAHMEKVIARHQEILLNILKKLERRDVEELIASLKRAVEILRRL